MTSFLKPAIIATAIALGLSAQAGVAKDATAKTKPEAFRVMHDFGRCVGASRSNAKLLGTIPYSPEEQAMAARISRAGCLRDSGELRFRAPLLRGLVAEQLYLQDLDGDRPRADLAPVFVDPGPVPPGGFNGPQQVAMTMIRFGQCVATVDKAGVMALLKTSATSQRERDAFKALQPALGQCLEAGGKFQMNPFTLRGFLAEGAYRHALEQAKKPNA